MIPRIQVKAEVTFVNLIDVTLVLLIIFMITKPNFTRFFLGSVSEDVIRETIYQQIHKIKSKNYHRKVGEALLP